MDNLVKCRRCGGDACYEIKTSEEVIQWHCFGCGFQSNSTLTSDNDKAKDILEVLPYLYKDLTFEDNEHHLWIPRTINISGKGMVFIDGKSIDDWEWAAVKADKKDPSKMDMKTLKKFKEDYLEALDYINYFNYDNN